MSRSLAALLFMLVTLPALALQAQQPGPPFPAAMDLKKVPLGSWAEYSMNVGQMPAMKSRMALVAKSSSANTLEMIVEGGMMAMAGGKMIMQNVVDADQSKEAPIKKMIMQIGSNDPMEMPIDAAQQKQFQKPNPKSYLKDETIKVTAGTFKAKHYRDKTPAGDIFDFWISQEAPPFGLVKIDAQQKSGPPAAQGPVKLELTALGKDAKMSITKKAKPYDQAVLMGQIMGGAKGGAAAGGGPTAPTKK